MFGEINKMEVLNAVELIRQRDELESFLGLVRGAKVKVKTKDATVKFSIKKLFSSNVFERELSDRQAAYLELFLMKELESVQDKLNSLPECLIQLANDIAHKRI